jgi:hypothetical protein
MEGVFAGSLHSYWRLVWFGLGNLWLGVVVRRASSHADGIAIRGGRQIFGMRDGIGVHITIGAPPYHRERERERRQRKTGSSRILIYRRGIPPSHGRLIELHTHTHTHVYIIV